MLAVAMSGVPVIYFNLGIRILLKIKAWCLEKVALDEGSGFDMFFFFLWLNLKLVSSPTTTMALIIIFSPINHGND